MEKNTLTRTGQTPLTFTGSLIAAASGERQLGKENLRWHELELYETTGGTFVVSIEYHTRWQGEANHSFADSGPAGYIADVVRAYNPTKFVAGYPPGEVYADKQDRLFSDLRLRYESLVSEILDDDRFAEIVE